MTLAALYEGMLRIRKFEEAVVDLYARNEIPGFVHVSIGQESSAVGVVGALRSSDRITTTHRGHGHLIAKGVALGPLMAELFGRSDGICHGYAGSMHATSIADGVLGANGIVGAGAPLAIGSALEQRYHRRHDITAAIFGEGAITTGNVHEAMVIAGQRRLPVLFVCEFNGYVEFSRYEDVSPISSPETWSGTYGLRAWSCEGANVREVRRVASEAIAAVREEGQPGFLLVRVTRVRGHYEGDPQSYRVTPEQRSDALANAASELDESDRGSIAERVDSEISQAIEFARRSPWPSAERLAVV